MVDISDSKCGDAACTGYAIGYTNEGEWVEYTINVVADAKYDITANVATAFETSAMQLFIDDKEITESVVAPKVDSVWTTYKVIDVGSAELKKGEHVLKLLITGAYLNVDWIQFTDPNTVALGQEIRVAPQHPSAYNVFSAMGKFLGHIDNAGADLSATLKQAGFANGIYIMRGVDHSRPLRVMVK